MQNASTVICERNEAIQNGFRGNSQDCFVASAFALRAPADKSLLAMTV
jgi:hypothetical protein